MTVSVFLLKKLRYMEPTYVDKDNCIEVLTSAGFYTLDEIMQ